MIFAAYTLAHPVSLGALKGMFGGQQGRALFGGLGPLERKLLKTLWKRGDATVRELMDTGDIDGAYTTVMTTLDRLHKKGILRREPDGRAFRYFPAQTEQEFNAGILRNTIQQMLGTGNQTPMSFLVDTVSEYDREMLDELERAIERKRRELKATSRKEKR